MKINKFLILKASLFIYTLQYFLSISNVEFGFKAKFCSISVILASMLCVMFIALKIPKRFKLKNLILVCLFILTGLWLYYVIDYSIYLLFFLYFVAAKYTSTDKFYSCLMKYMSVILSFIAGLSLLRIIPMGEKTAGRYGLGFNNYIMGFYVFHVSMMYIYLKRDKLNLKHFMKITFLNIIVFLFTKTRLTLINSLLVLFLMYIVNMDNFKLNKKLQKIVSSSFIILFGLEFYLTKEYLKFPSLNTLLTGRLFFQNRAINKWGIDIFPRNIHYGIENLSDGTRFVFYIDSGYMDLLVKFGIIFTIMMMIIYTYILFQSIKQKRYILTVWILGISIFNFVNTSFINILMDSSILMFWELKENRFSLKDWKNIKYVSKRINLNINK